MITCTNLSRPKLSLSPWRVLRTGPAFAFAFSTSGSTSLPNNATTETSANASNTSAPEGGDNPSIPQVNRRRNPYRSARPTNLTDEFISSPPDQSTDTTNDTAELPASPTSGINARTERRNQLVQLLIQDLLNTEQGEDVVDLQGQAVARPNDILQRIYDLYYESERAEVNANKAFHLAVSAIFRFGEAIKDRYTTLLSENGNDHNARVALNREIEALFPNASSRRVLGKISRARNVYEIFSAVGPDKIARIRSVSLPFFSELRSQDIDAIKTACGGDPNNLLNYQ